MMALPSSCRGPLKAFVLAGAIVSCILQLVQAQDSFSIAKEPQNPKVGQDVILIPRGAPGEVTLCKWLRDSSSGSSGEILSYTQFGTNSSSAHNSNGSTYTGRETLQQKCSLHIRKLTLQDTGNYTVIMETVDEGDVKSLEAVIYLQIHAPGQRIRINVGNQSPKPGETITLKPQVPLQQLTFCEWSVQTHDGHSKPILRQISGKRVEQIDSAYRDRVTVEQTCSLQIRQLRTSDTNNYTVTIRAQAQQPQQPQQPGQRDHGQEELDQEYTGDVYIYIADKQTGVKASSVSLSYSAGVLAGVLLGSLAWADALQSLFSLLLGSFSAWKPKP